MKRHARLCSVFSIFAAFCYHYARAQLCREQEFRSTEGRCLPCVWCPPGEEPDRTCGFGEGLGMVCRPCSADAFSSTHGLELCALRTRCEDKKRVRVSPGTAAADDLCGDCIPG
ncbi:tumor necrosis factor receptor superfamily member 19-like isoform X2 [Sphaerodactylus townsendi]|uniref:tumor necrosis factor receptor superfamily member 19-like isoform X2 n=1 Tax=Sphaerodactylus townsendi TaxID=933632 RepID=UPI0020262B26|nr:tumor necrosis factor receptor superfamily member 19-like isoform X2 [Sphaerodactylus townsendi]